MPGPGRQPGNGRQARHPPASSALIHIRPSLGAAKYANRSYLIGPTGDILSRYDKIHLFDISMPEGESHRESDRIRPGIAAIATQTPIGKIGLTICYDLRFPALYDSLRKAKTDIVSTGAAFTYATGSKGHWHVLNRARAIETASYILAPAQCGEHAGNRRTYGHSLIVNPWGEIIAEGTPDQPGIIHAELDLDLPKSVRSALPTPDHQREFTAAQ